MNETNVVIVTVGTHGIGRACVETLAGNGAQVVFTGRDQETGTAIVAETPNTTFVPGDVQSEDDCKKVVNAALSLGDGHISGLVNNAGIGRRSAFADATIEDWDTLFDINARSVFLYTRHALAGLCAARGSVVSVASIAGYYGEEGLAVYCASKAAIIGLTQALALELGDEVRFNAICPGQIETRMMAGIAKDVERRRVLEQRIPAGRFGAPNEIADVVAWLLSPQSSYVNGTIIPVDGGETAGLRTPPEADHRGVQNTAHSGNV